MGLNSTQTTLSNIGRRKFVRLDYNYHFFWKKFDGVLVKGERKNGKYYYLWEILNEASSTTLKKGSLGKEYILLDLPNIEAGTGKIIIEDAVDYIGSDKVIFGDSEIVISKLETRKGHIILNDKRKKYIGSTELIPYYVNNRIVSLKYLKYFLLNKKLLKKLKYLESGKTHHRVLPYEFLHLKVFIPDKEVQEKFVERIIPLEKEISVLERQYKPLQKIINDSFKKFGIKIKYPERIKEKESLSLPIGKINHGFLRCGVKYELFWESYNGKIFQKSKFKMKALKSFIFYVKPTILKKGSLDDVHTLIELDDIQPRTGTILNKDRKVGEINSDKVLFGDTDFLISKLRPYLGYVVINDKKMKYIGTTELIGFKINKNVNLDFIRYILLSMDFLEASKYLMYGKEHPRVHVADILNVMIPEVKTEIQEDVAKNIASEEKTSIAIAEKIKGVRNNIFCELNKNIRDSG